MKDEDTNKDDEKTSFALLSLSFVRRVGLSSSSSVVLYYSIRMWLMRKFRETREILSDFIF